MTSKHTPGPWEVAEEDGEFFVQVVNQPESCHPMFDRYRIVHGWIGGDPSDDPAPDLGTPEANARLIATAPELFEVLREMMRWYAKRKPDSQEFLPIHLQEAEVQRAMCAIAKATGEAQ